MSDTINVINVRIGDAEYAGSVLRREPLTVVTRCGHIFRWVWRRDEWTEQASFGGVRRHVWVMRRFGDAMPKDHRAYVCVRRDEAAGDAVTNLRWASRSEVCGRPAGVRPGPPGRAG